MLTAIAFGDVRRTRENSCCRQHRNHQEIVPGVGIGLSVCGGQDHEISVFKPGHGCEAGLEMLKAAEAEQEQAQEENI